MSNPLPLDPIPTHRALFEMYFPLDEGLVPPSIQDDVQEIADAVREGLAQALFEPTPTTAGRLVMGLADPTALLAGLPEVCADYLKNSPNPAVRKFLASSFTDLDQEERWELFAAMLTPTGDEYDPLRAVPALLRMVYLSTIWDFPLAAPLAEIEVPDVYVPHPEIYAQRHYPKLQTTRLKYDATQKEILPVEGEIDYLVVGSGPAGATLASELRRNGAHVVLIERGPFVVWGSMDTRSNANLMVQHDQITTDDGAIILRSGQTVGGGSTVNIDLAFSPLEATIYTRLQAWLAEGRLAPRYADLDNLSTAYDWVREAIQTRTLSLDEMNANNQVLHDGASAYGVDPSLYHLNRFPVDESPSPVDDKRDASRQLIVPALEDPNNPLSILPDTDTIEVLFEGGVEDRRAVGLRLKALAPWTEMGNTVVDPSGLGLKAGDEVTIRARKVVLSAGMLGTTRILLLSQPQEPALQGLPIGIGPILHPSAPLIGYFPAPHKPINLLEGLDSASYVDSFGVDPGYIFETMAGYPSYGAIMMPGRGKEVFEHITQFAQTAGFGVMLVDTPSETNRVTLNDDGSYRVHYRLSDDDKARFRKGIAAGVQMMFLAGATRVAVPTNENLTGDPEFDPTRGMWFESQDQTALIEKSLEFVTNRTLLTSAHLQATNKMGHSSADSVVSTNFRVWNAQRPGAEIPNLYVMDSSVFPTSVGANPMQSLYTFAKLLADAMVEEAA